MKVVLALVLLALPLLCMAEVAIQGNGKISYHFNVPNPETVLTCENMNFKAVEDLQRSVKNLTEQLERMNATKAPVFRGGFPITSATSPNAKDKCHCSCNTDVDFHFEYRDCQDVRDLSPLTLSGVYYVYPVTKVEHLLITNSSNGVKGKYWSVQTDNPTPVYCQLSSTHDYGWTVIQRRTRMDIDFNKTWNEFKYGFGDMKDGDFWLGLEHMHKITNQKFLVYSLRVTYWPANNIPIHKDYSSFKVGDEASKYKVNFGAGVGAMNTYLDQFKDGVFSTYDSDNDPHKKSNCAEDQAAGWWFKWYSNSKPCGMNNLNAPTPYQYNGGVIKKVQMQIRPVNA